MYSEWNIACSEAQVFCFLHLKTKQEQQQKETIEWQFTDIFAQNKQTNNKNKKQQPKDNFSLI